MVDVVAAALDVSEYYLMVFVVQFAFLDHVWVLTVSPLTDHCYCYLFLAAALTEHVSVNLLVEYSKSTSRFTDTCSVSAAARNR